MSAQKTVLVTGSSRGVGAAAAERYARAGCRVLIHYRNKKARAQRVLERIHKSGGTAELFGADLTSADDRESLRDRVESSFGNLDLLVLNASGGMERWADPDYPLMINSTSQLATVQTLLPLLPNGSRIVLVTSHQSHFIDSTPTIEEYEPIARSKRAGEDNLRAMLNDKAYLGVSFLVVSGDVIPGTITADLLERASPGLVDERRERAGRLFDVESFADELVRMSLSDPPKNGIHFVGDVSEFRANEMRAQGIVAEAGVKTSSRYDSRTPAE